MKRTEYREYISSEKWQERRHEYLKSVFECSECGLPRWLIIIAYDQDIHVHHKNYKNIGSEKDEDLQPLCKRCHEIKTFGNSALSKPKRHDCIDCGSDTWDSVSRTCPECRAVIDFQIGNIGRPQLINRELTIPGIDAEPWELIIIKIAQTVHRGKYFKFLTEQMAQEKNERDPQPEAYDRSNELEDE